MLFKVRDEEGMARLGDNGYRREAAGGTRNAGGRAVTERLGFWCNHSGTARFYTCDLGQRMLLHKLSVKR